MIKKENIGLVKFMYFCLFRRQSTQNPGTILVRTILEYLDLKVKADYSSTYNLLLSLNSPSLKE